MRPSQVKKVGRCGSKSVPASACLEGGARGGRGRSGARARQARAPGGAAAMRLKVGVRQRLQQEGWGEGEGWQGRSALCAGSPTSAAHAASQEAQSTAGTARAAHRGQRDLGQVGTHSAQHSIACGTDHSRRSAQRTADSVILDRSAPTYVGRGTLPGTHDLRECARKGAQPRVRRRHVVRGPVTRRGAGVNSSPATPPRHCGWQAGCVAPKGECSGHSGRSRLAAHLTSCCLRLEASGRSTSKNCGGRGRRADEM